MVKQTVSERRQGLRAKRILSIQYRIVRSCSKDFRQDWHLSTTYDMSHSGLSFYADFPVRVDDLLELNVVMSGILDIFKGYGKVVRVEKNEGAVFYLVALKYGNFRPIKQTTKTKLAARSRVKKAIKRK